MGYVLYICHERGRRRIGCIIYIICVYNYIDGIYGLWGLSMSKQLEENMDIQFETRPCEIGFMNGKGTLKL